RRGDGSRDGRQRPAGLRRRLRLVVVSRRPGRRHRSAVPRGLSGSAVRHPAAGADRRGRRGARQHCRRFRREHGRRHPRFGREEPLSEPGLLHAVCPDDHHSRAPADRTTRAGLTSRVLTLIRAPGQARARRIRVGLTLSLLVAAVVAPPSLPPFLLTVVMLSLVYSILAMSLDILMGYTGMESLGQAAFFG